jgi:hypothetical protein
MLIWLWGKHDMITGESIRNFRIAGVRLYIVTLVLIALSLAAYFAMKPSVIYLFLPLAPIFVVVLVKRPELGFLGLIFGALVIPLGIGTGSVTDINIAVILTGGMIGMWLFEMVRRRQVLLFISLPVIPLILFVMVTIFAYIGGITPQLLFARTAPITAQTGGLAVFILSAGIFLATANLLSEQRWLEYMVWLFLGLGVVYIASRLAYISRLEELFYRGASGATGSVFWVWLVALSASQGVFNNRLHWVVRGGLVGLALATLAVGWFQGRWWVSGYLPGFVALFTLVWLRSWRLGLLAMIAGLLYIFVFDPTLVTSLVGLKGYSIDTRAEALQILLGKVLWINPWLGLGPANYYWYTPLFPILGYYVPFNSHNQYVDIVVETGVLGILCYVLFILAVGIAGSRMRSFALEGFERAYVNGALAGLAGMVVAGAQGDWVIPFVYNIGLSGFRASVLGWLFLGGLIALQRLQGQKPNDLRPVPADA